MENFISPLRFKKSNYVIRLFSNDYHPTDSFLVGLKGSEHKLRYEVYKKFDLNEKSIHCRVGAKSVANRISNKVFIQLTASLVTDNQVTINEGQPLKQKDGQTDIW